MKNNWAGGAHLPRVRGRDEVRRDLGDASFSRRRAQGGSVVRPQLFAVLLQEEKAQGCEGRDGGVHLGALLSWSAGRSLRPVGQLPALGAHTRVHLSAPGSARVGGVAAAKPHTACKA